MLHRLLDGDVVDAHIELRTSLAQLEEALGMVKALLTTQLPDKPTPALYTLFAHVLQASARTGTPLLTLFLVKLLKHEGVLPRTCATLTQDATEQMHAMAALTRLADYQPPTPSFSSDVQRLFDQQFPPRFR